MTLEHFKQSLSKTFEIFLLTFCLIFVLYKGSECLDKLLKPPMSTNIEFKWAGENVPLFPSFTFCPDSDNNRNSTRYPEPYNKSFLEECGISIDDYIYYKRRQLLSSAKEMKWNSEKCPNAKEVYERAILTSTWDQLNFSRVLIKTRQSGKINLDPKDSKLTWSMIPQKYNGVCHQLSFSNDLKDAGIVKIRILFKSTQNLTFYVHKKDLIFTDFSELVATTPLKSGKTTVKVNFEVLDVIHVEERNCYKEGENQDLTQCELDYMHKVNMESLGCTVPYQLESKEICTEKKKMEKALNTFDEYNQKNIPIPNCTQPCTLLSAKFENIVTKGFENGVQNLEVNFNKLVRVMRTKVSYTFLEFMAEVGGYVGLFLGFSVYQLSNVFQFLLTKLQ